VLEEESMAQSSEATITITVPAVDGAAVGDAMDLVEQVVERYEINPVDADALFNAMVAIYIRQRAVYGDRPPSVCSFATCMAEPKA